MRDWVNGVTPINDCFFWDFVNLGFGFGFKIACIKSIVAGAIARENFGESNNIPIIIVASLSPIVSFLILVFPIVTKKTADQLGFTPNNTKFETLIVNGKAENYYKISFFSGLEESYHRVLHYISIFAGLAMGYFSIIAHLNHHGYSRNWTLELCFGGVSIILILFWALSRVTHSDGPATDIGIKRFFLFMEYIGLYYYMVTMVMVSVIAGDLITNVH